MPFITTAIALWIYPILAFVVVKTVSRREIILKTIKWLIGITLLVVISFYLKISTTIPIVDWILFTLPFLSMSCLLWLTQFQSNKPVKIIGLISMIIVFGISYVLSTVGLLGLGFIVAEYEPNRRIELSNNLEYRETWLGNAISAHRGKRFEVYQQIKWLPFIERRIACKENYNLIVYPDSINVIYDELKHEVYLSTNKRKRNKNEIWKDTLNLSHQIKTSD